MSLDDDTPTLEGATNVVLTQRAATSPFAREEVNIQGNEHPWQALGFDAAGILGAHSVDEMIAADPVAAAAALGIVKVSTEAELRSAVLAGGIIVVEGEIVLTTGSLDLTVAKTQLRASTTNIAKIVRPGTTNTLQRVVAIQAPQVELHGLEITANNSLFALTFNPPGTTGDPEGDSLNPPTGQQLDYGVVIDHLFDCSDFVISHCYIHHVTMAIVKEGSQSFPWVDRGLIVGNRIESFSWHGIYVSWCLRDLKILENWIWGRCNGEPRTGGPAGITETHPVSGNAIYVGNYIQRATIRGNDCGYCDRHGIEIVNTHTNDAESNNANIVSENSVHDFIVPAGNTVIRHSMGISITCGGNGAIIVNNQIRNTTWYGIEIHNSGTSQGNYVISGNQICNVIGLDPYSSFGISINSCTGAIVTGNYIKRIAMASNASTLGTVGIWAGNGNVAASPTLPAFVGVTIANNELVDAGCYGVSFYGVSSVERTAPTIKDNVLRLTAGRQHRPSLVQEIAVIMTTPGISAVVKGNTLFFPASLPLAGTPATVAGFELSDVGTVHNGTASVNGSGGGRANIAGTNLSISY